MTNRSRPIVALLLTEATRAMVLSHEAAQRLSAVAGVRAATGDPATWDLAALLRGAVGCITGWGTPGLDRGVIDASRDLRLVAHTAGSVRKLLPVDVIGSRLRVCQAASAMAGSVAEMVVLQILTGLRELHRLDRGLREAADWRDLRRRHPGRLLGALTVGVVGASRTGRAVLRLLRPFGSRLLVHDPYLAAQDAEDLGADAVGLDPLLSGSDIVTLHAPLLPETQGMIGGREIGLLRDGALLINSARAGLVDYDALLCELRTGRITAALDVFPVEPLPPDSEWRRVPHAIISPHAAGHSIEGHLRQGDQMVAEVERFLRGEPLRHEITRALRSIMA